MRFGDCADGTGLDQFHDAAVVVAGVNLNAHLCGDARVVCRFADDPRFVHAVSQRLLAVDVLPELKGRQRGEGVRVLAGADDDGVEVARMIIQFAEVDELACSGMPLGGGVQVPLVDVAEGDDVFGLHVPHVVAAAAAGADDGDVELVVEVLPAEDGRGSEGE